MNIDREIAEKIMKYVKRQGGPYYIAISSGMKEITCHGIKDVDAVLSWWHPSTDIKQAFEVVEKMRKRGWLLNGLSALEEEENHKGWEACFEYYNKQTREATIEFEEANTPAMAICLAALKAVEA